MLINVSVTEEWSNKAMQNDQNKNGGIIQTIGIWSAVFILVGFFVQDN